VRTLVYGTDQHGPFGSSKDKVCEGYYCFLNGSCTTSDYLIRYFNVGGPNVGSLVFDDEISCYKTNDTGYFISWYANAYTVYYIDDGVITDIYDCDCDI
jgi:hypothetical protein